MERSSTGAELINGRPYFATHNGERMHRTQWLDATKDERRAAFVQAIKERQEEDIYDLHGITPDEMAKRVESAPTQTIAESVYQAIDEVEAARGAAQ